MYDEDEDDEDEQQAKKDSVVETKKETKKNAKGLSALLKNNYPSKKNSTNDKNKNKYQQNDNQANQYKNNEDLIRTNQYKAEIDFCNKCREVLDNLLGENACLKIFGKTNRYGMFNDYFEQLAKILGTLEIDVNAIKEDLVKKYKIDEGTIK